MENQKFTAEFREEAVRQVLDRGYSVKEVSDNLGVSTCRNASARTEVVEVMTHNAKGEVILPAEIKAK